MCLLGLMGLASCDQDTNLYPVRGAVLKPGETVEATNNNGKVRISYVTAEKRRYEWDGRSRVITMISREEPFDKKLGLYEPADSWGFEFWQERLVVQESVISFENLDQVYAFLRQSKDYMKWVYTDDGLVIGFGRTPARKQINIDLWQLLVREQKPEGLVGARPEDIVMRREK